MGLREHVGVGRGGMNVDHQARAGVMTGSYA